MKKMQLLLLLPFAYLTMSIDGCKEEIKQDDGPVAAENSVVDTLCYTVPSAQFAKMGLNEYSLAAKSIAAFSSSPQTVQKEEIQIFDEDKKTCNTDGGSIPCIEYTYVEALTDLKSSIEDRFERSMLVPDFQTASNSLEVRESTNVPMQSNIDEDLCVYSAADYARIGISMSYHNFKVTSSTQDPPIFVKERPDCEGIQNCKIKIKTIEFDQILKKGDQRARNHYIFNLSDDVPYTSRMLKKCITHSITQNGQVLPIHECRDVLDFRNAGPLPSPSP